MLLLLGFSVLARLGKRSPCLDRLLRSLPIDIARPFSILIDAVSAD
jgi:hypothetical protein